MTHITYEIVEHDGGWAYRLDGVVSDFSEPRRGPQSCRARRRGTARPRKYGRHFVRGQGRPLARRAVGWPRSTNYRCQGLRDRRPASPMRKPGRVLRCSMQIKYRIWSGHAPAKPVPRANFPTMARRGDFDFRHSQVRILAPQPPSPISHLLCCDTQKMARLRAISQVRSQSPLTDLGIQRASRPGSIPRPAASPPGSTSTTMTPCRSSVPLTAPRASSFSPSWRDQRFPFRLVAVVMPTL